LNRARRPLVAGNWKMNLGGAAGIELAQKCVELARSLPHVDVLVAPPFTVLAAIAHEADGTRLQVAGQNMHAKASGAFTGEISAPMLKEAGCGWVILGHSERRQLFGETDAGVAEKTRAALDAGLVPIVCIGETLAEREAKTTLDVVKRQLEAFLPVLATAKSSVAIAYEPVWAIGTGRNASPDDAEEVHASIRSWLGGLGERTRILYGGSVKPDNARALLGMPNVDGLLIGGASLDAASFGAIARTAEALAAG
jgi:triosephosphate isomerase